MYKYIVGGGGDKKNENLLVLYTDRFSFLNEKNIHKYFFKINILP